MAMDSEDPPDRDSLGQLMTGRPRLPAHQPRPAGAPTVLEGMRVIDFTRVLAGPYATQQLADLGAEVIKIETPVIGDDSRHYTTTSLAGECVFYLSINRNKKSVTLDLKTAAGQQVARDLIAGADIVVENFSNGTMRRFNLDYESLSEFHRRLIYCSITGYGSDDPSAVPRRTYDAIIQAASGFMSLTGEEDRLPMRTTVPIIDTASAMQATSAVLAAIIARDRIGRGQFLEIALLDVAVAVQTLYCMTYLVSGRDLPRNGNRAPQTAPSDIYMASDGPIFITCGNNALFRRLAAALSRPELADDPLLADNPMRVRNIERMTSVLNGILATDTRARWMTRLMNAGVPAAPVASIGEAVASEDARRRRLVSEIPHPKAGSVPNVRSPFRFELTPVADPVAAPLLGQHTQDILRGTLGYDDVRIAALAEAGAFGPRSAAQTD